MEVRPLELVHRHPQEKGHEEIYELLAKKQALSDDELERREHFWKERSPFSRRQMGSRPRAFPLQSASGDTTDGPVEFYIRRVEQLRAGVPALESGYGRI